jgi:hypothetical protein
LTVKTKKLADGRILTAGRGTGRRAAAWLLGLTLASAALLFSTALFAEVLDDFSDPAKSQQIWTGSVWFGTGDQLVTNGQVRISVTPFGDHGFSSLGSVRTFTLREGRTLEFRADLVSSSGDGAVAQLGFALGDVDVGYVFNLDQDTISLLKREDPFQLFLLTNGLPIDVTNVKLVVSMTGVQSNVLVQLKILDNEQSGRVVYATNLWDTPNRDPMQVGTDDPPGNCLGRAGRFYLGLYHDNVGWLDPTVEIPPLGEAEVVFDNAEVLEYDSAWIAPPSTAVLLSWPENTAEEQIVVGANSLTSSVWTPWPEPIFKRFGELCMAVPTTNTQQFFKLVPGTQFIDDFDPPKWPYASKGGWVPGFYVDADTNRWAVTSSNGVLRVQTLAIPVDPSGRLVIKPPGPYVQVKDFWVAVDILNFDTTRQDAAIGLAARVGGDLDHWPGANNGYIANLWPNWGGANKAVLNLWTGSGTGGQSPVFDFKPGTPYRFIFSGVGRRLSVELIDLELQQRAVAPLVVTDSRFSQGAVGFFMGAGADTFFVTGTKP